MHIDRWPVLSIALLASCVNPPCSLSATEDIRYPFAMVSNGELAVAVRHARHRSVAALASLPKLEWELHKSDPELH